MKIKRRLLQLLIFFSLGVNYITSQTIVDEKSKVKLLAKSDSLFALGVDLYNAEKYEEAIPVFTESDKIDKAVLDSTSNRRDYSAMWLASCYYQLGDTIKASVTHKYYNYPPVDRRLTVKSDSLGTLAWDTWRNEDLPTAVQYAIQRAEIEKGIVGDQHVWYGNTATIIAMFYCAMRKYEAAAEYERIAQDIIGQTYWESLVHFASSLHSQASQLCDSGYYTRAVCLEEQALAIAKHLLGKEHADEFIEIGKTSKILVEATRKALFEQKKTTGKRHPDYIELLRRYTKYLSEEQDSVTTTIRLASEVMELTKSVYGKYTTQYVEALSELVDYSYNGPGFLWNDPRTCFKISKISDEAYDVIERVYGSEFVNFTLMSQLAYCYRQVKDYDQALVAYKKAEEAYLNAKGSNVSIEYLKSIAEIYSLMGNAEMAIDYALQARNVCEAIRKGGQWSSSWQDSEDLLYDEYLVKYYMLAGLQEDADNIINDRTKVYGERYGTTSLDYAKHINALFNICVDCAYYDEALNLGQAMEKIYAINDQTEQIDHEQLLKSMLLIKLHLGENNDAYDYLTKLQTVKDATTTDAAVEILSDLAVASKDDVFALKIYAFARDVISYYAVGRERSHKQTKSVPYTQIRLKQAECYANMGDYDNAYKEAEQARQDFEEILGDSTVEYAEAMRVSAKYNSRHGGTFLKLVAERQTLRAQKIFQEHYGDCHPMTAITVQDRAEYAAAAGDYAKALKLSKTACICWVLARNSIQTQTRRIAVQREDDYLECLRNLSFYHYKGNNYQEALRQGETTESLYSKNMHYGGSKDHIGMICLLAEYAYASGDTILCSDNAAVATYLYSQYIKQKFSELSSNYRNMLWATNSQWFEHKVPLYSYKFATTDLIDAAYNSVLLYKGLLLNSEIAFRDLIMQSGDSTAISSYIKIEQSKENFLLWLAHDSSSDSSLHSALTNLWTHRRLGSVYRSELRSAYGSEASLVDQIRRFGNYTKNLTITWKQVRSRLSNGDAAVEFVSFPLNADSTMYIAYALKMDWEYPKMIPLFEEKQLLAVQKGDRYTTDFISRLVWKPLDEVMQGVERVYFAPSGELYNIAIESIPTHEDGGETLVGEHRDFYRLSSTRELALIKDESRWNEAAVYGGLQYGMSVEGMIEEDGKYEKTAGQKRGDTTPSYYVVREDSIGRGDRDLAQGLAYLEGTKREAEAITHDLERKAVDARLFTDSIGTETSFKALGGKKTSIIHIGTHGFFNDRKKEYKEDKLLQMFGRDNQPKVIEDDALTRSGLYFAGADNVILNGLSAVPDSIDDGRLTAAEIAQLDLRGLDMVVLSACQTGLGEITGDGVFGLQRGFKKAGAQTIVMSLWKVDDEATTEFMTTFFENMKIDRDGHPLNKHEAFKEAQSKLKRDKDKYSDPYCWAAFVMLDGIN